MTHPSDFNRELRESNWFNNLRPAMAKITTDADALDALNDVIDDQDVDAEVVLMRVRSYLVRRLASTSPAPDGWVLVPREPTEAMLSIGYGGAKKLKRSIWQAMVNAAPQPVVENGHGD